MDETGEEKEGGSHPDYAHANLSKLLKQKLKVNDKLSPQFHKFHEGFAQNIDFIIQYEYNILPQQKCYQTYGGSMNSTDQSYQYLSD